MVAEDTDRRYKSRNAPRYKLNL